VNIFSVFFFLSGFCSLVYQVVWLRLAMADFGVTTALVSIVLSIFMAGLALGSWGGGRLVQRFAARPVRFFIALYAAAELSIGVSGIAVAPLLRGGRSLLAADGSAADWGSLGYYLASGLWIALILLPFCTCMGATFPLAMAAIRGGFHGESPRSFSLLYVANVFGAMAGTLGSAFVFIELLGFSKTLLVAVAGNFTIGIWALVLSRTPVFSQRFVTNRAAASRDGESTPRLPGEVVLPLLFASGLSSLGMEVVWTRQFVPFVGPFVYSFATILAIYLAATAAGSRMYRIWAESPRSAADGTVWRTASILAGCFAVLPLLAADPRLRLPSEFMRVGYGLAPFCGTLGFLTSMLVDNWSDGDPGRAGRAYAINTIGCIVGPLLAGFLLLPAIGERWTVALLSVPFFALGFLGLFAGTGNARKQRSFATLAGVAAIVGLLLVTLTRDFESIFPGAVVRRDHTATVVAAGAGMQKRLLINGIGITALTPITKMMAHLPLASLESAPRNVLVLCFGMGTSFRSALSWGVPVTVVDLVPSVPPLFGYFHADGPALLRSPDARVVIDDARRFLERTRETFDAIVIDPPPPVEAAGSSLLYSREFYETAARRLRPGGILQQWLPSGEPIVEAAVARALDLSFSDVRVFPSVEGWGLHYVASQTPIHRRSAAELAARLPQPAAQDLLEWGPAATAQDQFQRVLGGESGLRKWMDADPRAPVLTDDRPVNEYFWLRHVFHR